MRNFYSLFLFAPLILASCKKNNTIQPTAVFTVSGQSGGVTVIFTDSAHIFGTHDLILLTNTSQNADSVHWDFGNGQSSGVPNTSVSYDNAGVFTITLTAINKDGARSVTSRKVTVMERVLKDFSIDFLYLNKFVIQQPGLPVFTKLDIWLVVKFSDSIADPVSPDGDIAAPVVFQSPAFANLDSGFHSALHFAVPSGQKVIINTPVNNPKYTSVGKGVIAELYGQDGTGTYLLSSSAWTALQLLSGGGDPAYSKTFTLGYYGSGGTNLVTLDCVYQ